MVLMVFSPKPKNEWSKAQNTCIKPFAVSQVILYEKFKSCAHSEHNNFRASISVNLLLSSRFVDEFKRRFAGAVLSVEA
jgi:hypothetical protein